MVAPPESLVIRTLVGVDADGRYESALHLVRRLDFAGNRLTLAHVDPPVGMVLTPAPLVYQYDPASELQAGLRAVGGRLLLDAAEAAQGIGTNTTTVYEVGHIADTLMTISERERTDLIAIGSKRHGAMECFLLGSVGRALAIGSDSSFLVARGKVARESKVRAVFATDHSEYARRSFARLLDMAPQGLGEVTIITALESSLDNAFGAELGYDDRTPETLTEAERRMRLLGERMVGQLHAKGIEADYRLIEGKPENAVRRTMEEDGADLLILGSRGHGIVERLLVGSLALHEVVAEPYSVLVLRIPEAS